MKSIYVLVEHRQGKIRDITLELFSHAAKIATTSGAEIVGVIIGSNTDCYIPEVSKHANALIVFDDPKLKDVNAEIYQRVLAHLIKERKPSLMLIAHSYFGMELGASLAVELGIPIVTDCTSIEIKDQIPFVNRMMYSGKVCARLSFKESLTYLVSLRSGSIPAHEGSLSARVEKLACPLTQEIQEKRFIEYLAGAVGEVDISQSDIVVGVGRGIKEADNIPIVKKLADALGGVVGASRPVTDAGWLSKDRQVGSSGKTLKAKLYIAVGISGSFQHVIGIKGCQTIVAINKDPNAPIFGVADYGIVGDLFKVVPPLTEKILALKS